MPELPEVETVRRGLERLLHGAVLERIELRRPDLRRPMPVELQRVAGPIGAIRRRAKYLLIDLPGGTLLSHLGMTGTWRCEGPVAALGIHDHAVLHLEDRRTLVYQDPRRFGLLDWIPAGTVSPDLAGLGPEPLDPGFIGDDLYAALRGRKQAVKPVIMDQAVVVGVGNIYAQEALFRARIAPSRPAGRVSRERCTALVAAIREVLTEAIAAGGSTISDFRSAGGSAGYFQTRFQVYDKAGQPCPACATPLRHRVLGGRTTCWCANCQR